MQARHLSRIGFVTGRGAAPGALRGAWLSACPCILGTLGILGTLAVAALPARAAGSADGAMPAGSMLFDIPAQPLAAALDAYSGATGVLALYNGNLAVGRLSTAVQGRLTPAGALALLLQGSGLAAQYTTAQTFVLVPAPNKAAPVQAPAAIALAALAQQDGAERRYAGLVQASINRSLCAEPQTEPGSYRLAVRFLIGPAGEVTQLRLLGSTGDAQRDAAIAAALEHASVGEAPPPQMAQPFTMVMLPRSSGGSVDCMPAQGGGQDG